MKPILMALLLASAGVSAAPFTPEQEARIRELIRETLVQDPAILDEAAESWQRQQEADYQSNLNQLIKRQHQLLFESPTSPRLGAKAPALTLVLFTDYNCPYCKRLDPEVMKLLGNHPDLALIIKFLPFKGESATAAARLAISQWQRQPDAFLPLHQTLMGKRGMLDETSIRAALKATGNRALSMSDESAREVNINLQLARELGVQGTPALLIGNRLLPGAVSYEQLEQTLQDAREDAS
ncbi:protein-disulfide isomerase [Aeromonas diversa CDC 2478-85]|uniref:Protein-disulfide isomerase n=1 Tax=Aeromonas diversa CDC 2478-85 TaxID=1268237 RepID=N9U5W6_9GAMM|nr:DsbA family protein [Aeromonas diversa]ENY73764.1 protein-disulfide isomerase [Aeromonas diversa CDC 2478-85]